MDNLIFKKVWQDESEDFFEIEISAKNEFINARQYCYVSGKSMLQCSKKINNYIKDYTKETYICFGDKKGRHTPAFSMRILPAEWNGKLKIEVDLEINDNDQRIHRCVFYVITELGLLEKFGNRIKFLNKLEIETSIGLLNL